MEDIYIENEDGLRIVASTGKLVKSQFYYILAVGTNGEKVIFLNREACADHFKVPGHVISAWLSSKQPISLKNISYNLTRKNPYRLSTKEGVSLSDNSSELLSSNVNFLLNGVTIIHLCRLISSSLFFSRGHIFSSCWTVLLPIVFAFIIFIPCVLYSLDIFPININLF